MAYPYQMRSGTLTGEERCHDAFDDIVLVSIFGCPSLPHFNLGLSSSFVNSTRVPPVTRLS